MYGSKKPGKEPYLVTSVIKYQPTTKDFKIQKSIKAKKVLKTSEVKKVSKPVKGDKEKTSKEKEK